jgi:hypothetical protein
MARREDTDASVAVAFGGKHEHGLGEVQLASQPLHLLRGATGAIREHPELIALERRVGEDIDDQVFVCRHGGRSPSRCAAAGKAFMQSFPCDGYSQAVDSDDPRSHEPA